MIHAVAELPHFHGIHGGVCRACHIHVCFCKKSWFCQQGGDHGLPLIASPECLATLSMGVFTYNGFSRDLESILGYTSFVKCVQDTTPTTPLYVLQCGSCGSALFTPITTGLRRLCSICRSFQGLRTLEEAAVRLTMLQDKRCQCNRCRRLPGASETMNEDTVDPMDQLGEEEGDDVETIEPEDDPINDEEEE